jgi:hypothetical protein
VIECDPAASAEVLYVAVPLLTVPVPNFVFPSANVTIPVAVAGVKLAVKVTGEPTVNGFADEVNVIVVPPGMTVWVSPAEVLLLSFVSPL